jgi:protein gp37
MHEKPLDWKKPQMIFVNSMSDLFHKDVPFEFIEKVFDVMKRAHWHFPGADKACGTSCRTQSLPWWADNIWMGTVLKIRLHLPH